MQFFDGALRIVFILLLCKYTSYPDTSYATTLVYAVDCGEVFSTVNNGNDRRAACFMKCRPCCASRLENNVVPKRRPGLLQCPFPSKQNHIVQYELDAFRQGVFSRSSGDGSDGLHSQARQAPTLIRSRGFPFIRGTSTWLT